MLRHSYIPCSAPVDWRIPTPTPVPPGIDDVLLFFENTDKMADQVKREFFNVFMSITRRCARFKLNVIRNIRVYIAGDQVFRSTKAEAAAIRFPVLNKPTRS